jgi:nicotinate-nucleotide--dimethylbenzimidazole phosphoribosyltransferase
MQLLAETVTNIQPQNQQWRQKATDRIRSLTMPPWALGDLLDVGVDLAGIHETLTPDLSKCTIVVMAGDHGIAKNRVSAFPQEVTAQMVANFARGGAAVNVLARQVGAKVVVMDVGVAANLDGFVPKGSLVSLAEFDPAAQGVAQGDDTPVITEKIMRGTLDMSVEPAMTINQAMASIEKGILLAQKLAPTTHVFITGEMGIGNTTASAAITSVLCDEQVRNCTGKGTGLDSDGLERKVALLEQALRLNAPKAGDAIDILAKVGGLEIGALAGLILGAASLKKPILVDGFISTAAALLAHRICPDSLEYMFASHLSEEQGHKIALQTLGKKPMIQMGLRLGEGTGAVLCYPILKSAVAILNEMATFEDAGIQS